MVHRIFGSSHVRYVVQFVLNNRDGLSSLPLRGLYAKDGCLEQGFWWIHDRMVSVAKRYVTVTLSSALEQVSAHLQQDFCTKRGSSWSTSSKARHHLVRFVQSASSTRSAADIRPLSGANDATLPPCTQALSLDKYVANLNHYIFSLVEPASEYYQPEARIVLVTPPPLVQSMRLEQPLPPHVPKGEQGKERNLEYTRKFKDACLEVGNAWDAKTGGKVRVLDAWTTIVDAAGGEQDDLLRPLYQDGLHFTAQGYRAIFDGLMKLIMSSWEDLNPVTMKQTIPRYVAGTKEWAWHTTPPLLAGKA